MTGLLKSIKKLSRIGLFRPKWPSRPSFVAGTFALQAHVRRKMRTAARIAIPAIVLNGIPGLASAQDAWVGNVDNFWNNSANWNPGIPGANGTATFGAGPPTSISMLGGVSVGTLQFNAPSYTFDALDGLTINGNGVNASLGNTPTFNVIGTPGHSTPPMIFNGISSAGTAQIIAGNEMSINGGFDGGFIKFFANSTADQATITTRDGSNTEFHDSSTAGHATLIVDSGGESFFNDASTADHATITINDGGTLSIGHINGFPGGPGGSAGDATIITENGGRTRIETEGSGGNARFITNGTGFVDISGLTTNGTTAGSIEGGGTYFLGSKQLTVGSNDLSTTVSGLIADGGPQAGGVGGSLVKVGTGTLTLTANDPYSGGTTVAAGILAVGDPAHPGAALSGGGSVMVQPGATLGGYGSVTGPVTNDGTIAAGNALIAFTGGPTGNFTINGNLHNGGVINLADIGNQLTVVGNYVGAGGSLQVNTFLGTDGSSSDKLVISSGAATGSTIVRVINVGGPGAETLANGILLVQAINGATTAPGAFALSSGELRAGAFDYDLFRGSVDASAPNDWFLRSDIVVPPTPPGPLPPEPIVPPEPPPEPLPPGVYPIIGPEIATYGVVQPLARQLGLASLGTLNDRLGDTYTDGSAPCVTASALVARKGPELAPAASTAGCGLTGWPSSVWGRFFGQSIDTHYRAFADPRADGHLAGFQAGIDLLRGSFIAGHQERAGLYVAYGNTDVDVKGLVTNPAATAYVLSHTGKLDLDAWSGGAYWTHVGPSGWYLDAVLQATRYGGSATTDFAKLDTTGTGFISSLEGGYPFAFPQFGPGFVIEPQSQILWQRVAFEHNNDGLGDVGLGKTSGASGRVGVRAKWTILAFGDEVWEPYLRANLWEDWGARARTTFSGTDVVPLLERGKRLQFGGGLTAKINANVSLYANADYEFAVGNTDGGKRDGIRGAVGLRYTW
jgi:outer membrane autotransporter protein